MEIKVKKIASGKEGATYAVLIQENGSETHHHVTITKDLMGSLVQGSVEEERMVMASFRFLLDRESKESILPRFDIKEISQYYPEYEDEIAAYIE